jgi:hypothetical protein
MRADDYSFMTKAMVRESDAKTVSQTALQLRSKEND